ncbi:MAG: hypothetical protein K1X68_13180 [Saprospiraceae bacterium]|nr:hypothetical protein [Saprospiraceae bacterium]HMW39794.1 hypothetical protein [Saprospiraceae bacterium]HMX86924.1 hypothetical protein [Saprospiraceae bacterium]HMZ38968.1 hypothetical protein [Saprospiraceae bacterium]HNA64987.1 hypothetical protein [Saprospiraceae bacterium]
MKYTRGLLKKLEELAEQIGYKLRYEQGHFQAGYCRVESRKLIIINKFFDLEGRINCFLELLPGIPVDQSMLDEDIVHNYQKIMDLRVREEAIAS